ncbi:MAG: baseplate J/gp47 family protein [Deltaproteobacteria bacterium]|nr:baseplate J/gp47 family protein [Deltaproteobacteria bacterium]
MALETLTFDELHALVLDGIRTRITGADVSPGSDYDLLARAVAIVAQGSQRRGLYIADQVLPSTAEAAFLELHAAIRGLSRLQPTRASGRVLLVFDETPASNANTTQSSGSVLTHADGRGYTTTADATSAKPAWTGKTVGYGSTPTRIVVNPDVSTMAAGDVLDISGVPRAIREVISSVNAIDLYHPLNQSPLPGAAITARRGVVALVQADDAEAAGNKVVGDTLTLASPAGASPNDFQAATYVQELSGGGDLETDDELRDRVRAYMANRPGSGNPEDFRSWARETPGVRIADAFVYAGFRGLGTVDVVLWGPTGERQPTETTRAAVATHLATVAGFADDVTVKVPTYKATPTPITLQLLPRVGYEPDGAWSANAIAAAPASTASRIYLVTAPSSVEIGDRVLVPLTVAGRARLAHVEVLAVNASAAPYYLDVVAMAAAPVSPLTIHPGGPLCDDVIEAVEGLFDALTPGITTGGVTYARHPSTGPDHKLYPSHVYNALASLEGAAKVVVVAPSSSGDEPAAQEILVLGRLTIEHVTS